MFDWFVRLDAAVQTTIISAIVGGASALMVAWWSHLLGRWGVEHRLRTEYEFEQRKALRDVTARYQGRLLEVGERLNHRMWNLHKNEAEGWLAVGGRYGNPESYYLNSTVLRFLSFMALAREFEQQALYLDASIAKEQELLFLKYVKALQWAAVDVYLFDGLKYDSFHAKDHFFRDQLASECEGLLRIHGGEVPSLEEFLAKVESNGEPIRESFRYFDGLRSDEDRYRWDRLVTLHLLLMCFLNEFGYDIQESDPDQFTYVKGRIRNRQVLQNLRVWIPKLGLKDTDGAQELVATLKDVPEPSDTRGPRAWMAVDA